MKTFAVAAALALASVASAQLDNIPSCALSCFLDPLANDGCEALEDFKCHCEKAESLFAAVIPCVQEACSAEDQQAAISAVEGTCKAAGVEVDVPVMPGQESSAAPSAEPTPTPTETPEATPTETQAEETPEETPAESSSVSGYPTPSGNGTAPTGEPTPTVSEFPGAAPRATQAAGLLAAAGIALFAL